MPNPEGTPNLKFRSKFSLPGPSPNWNRSGSGSFGFLGFLVSLVRLIVWFVSFVSFRFVCLFPFRSVPFRSFPLGFLSGSLPFRFRLRTRSWGQASKSKKPAKIKNFQALPKTTRPPTTKGTTTPMDNQPSTTMCSSRKMALDWRWSNCRISAYICRYLLDSLFTVLASACLAVGVFC